MTTTTMATAATGIRVTDITTGETEALSSTGTIAFTT